ncbi:MAG: MFS transporter, partial [Pseudomonadota bacterium]
TFIFSVYFARGIYGDEVAGSAAWGYTLGAAGFAVAILSPILGAIADQGGPRKIWIFAFTLVTIVTSFLLWYALPDPSYVVYALTLVVIATITFELALVFYNAMLADLASPGALGRLSGFAWGLGYIGGLACLVVALVGFVQPAVPWFGVGTEEAANIRATGPLVAVWFGLFSLPLFLLTPDRPSGGLGIAGAVSAGLQQLGRTLRSLGKYGNIVRFLIASALYRDGLTTLFAVGGLYAAGTFGMSFEQILIFAIGLNVTAGLGAAGFAFMDDRSGSKPTVLVALAGLIVLGAALLVVDGIWVFIGLALGLGLFVGPAQAASRSLLARISPPDMQTEMFGLYSLTGKSIAFLGPVAFAALTDAFNSQRVGMASILAFWIVGGALLLTVRERG